MIRILYTIIFTLVFFSNVSLGQTFLGKRLSVDAGTSFRPNLMSIVNFNENHFRQWSVLPPGFQLGIGFTPTSRINVRLEAGMNKPQITGVKFQSEYLFDTINQKYIDSFYFNSNTIDFSLNLRFYQEYAPIGRYFSMHGGINKTTTTIVPTTSYWNVTPNTTYYANDKHVSSTVEYSSLKFGLGFGRTQLITRHVYLDFGCRSSLILIQRCLEDEEYTDLLGKVNTPFYKEGYSIDYSGGGNRVFTSGARRSLQNAYLLEIYLNIGFSL